MQSFKLNIMYDIAVNYGVVSFLLHGGFFAAMISTDK